MNQAKPLWKGKTGGGHFGQKSLLLMFKFLDVRIGYLFVALTIPFYMLFGRKGYHASFNYFHKQLGMKKWDTFRQIFRQHYRFGQIIIDRFAVLAKQKKIFQFEIDDIDLFEDLLSKPEGLIMGSSHVGNFELLGYLYPQEKKPISSLIFGGEATVIQKAREKQFGKNNISVITVDEEMNHIYTINNILSQGGIVCVPADRIFGSQKSVYCSFLKGNAKFPIGPFMLAAIHHLPFLAVFVMKTSSMNYKMYLKIINENSAENSSKKRAEMMLQSYVIELESIVKQYPEQWFNFYEFWSNKSEN